MNHPMPLTWCNPLALPDYPRGMCSQPKAGGWGWQTPAPCDFRELADPSVLYHDGHWYLYPSCRMAYVSEDFATWRSVPMQPAQIGYAPTVVHWRGQFLLTACGAGLWRAEQPLGPFTEMGPLLRPDGQRIDPWADPMLYADDDGELYAYWGLGGPGIHGARLDPDQPNRCATAPALLFGFTPDHWWERLGEHHEDPTRSFVEGAWMVKVGGTYYLTYAAPGTEWHTYGMAAYTARHPLGPFTVQPRNPILYTPHGLVHGPGHGCIVRGPGETLWAFYTCLVRNLHYFERRIGLDPAGIDADGNLFVRGASSTPQLAPGQRVRPQDGNDAGWVPLSTNKPVTASSYAPGRWPGYAVDEVMRTWWEAAHDDAAPWLEVDLQVDFTVHAVRLLWAEPALDYDAGTLPGSYRYRVDGRLHDGGEWTPLLDATANTTDLLCDYRACPGQTAGRVRLVITGWPAGQRPALLEFTVFGRHPRA